MTRTHVVAAVMATMLCASGLVGDAHPRSPQDAPAATPIDDPEAYAVYAAVLQTPIERSSRKSARYVVRREADIQRDCTPVGEPEDSEWAPVIASFVAANAVPHVVREGRDLGKPYTVVPREAIYALFTPPNLKGWDAFYQRYPDVAGYEGVSAVGFDAGKTRALVYVEHHCHYLCGHGRTVFLQKRDGRWQSTAVPGVRGCGWVS